ncbi:MAG: BrnT family toxin [Geminicoccaceae bacterium]
MNFEWDESKRLRNIRKHGVDFIGATAVFDGRPVFTYYTPRDGEDRWGTVGLIDDRFHLVVWTWRGEGMRIISAYRADDWEIREYRKLFG